MRRIAGVAGALILSAAIVIAGRAIGAPHGDTSTDQPAGGDAQLPSPLTVASGAGQHWRLDTPKGAIHVWTPAGYHPDGAGTIVYVHGYWTDVDSAWRDHLLPEQFALAGVNAMFIACEAPTNNKAPVYWPSLSELLRTVQTRLGAPLPSGPVIVIGHSGAFRTLIPWLDDPRVDWMLLVDGAYSRIEPFIAWVKESPAHHLYFVGDDTIEWTEEMRRQLPTTVEVDRFTFDGLPRDARAARIVYVRSQFAHMPIVTGGIALPSLIRAMPLEMLPTSPWSVQLGDLPFPDAALPDGSIQDGGPSQNGTQQAPPP